MIQQGQVFKLTAKAADGQDQEHQDPVEHTRGAAASEGV
jgi:hypothetical protein